MKNHLHTARTITKLLDNNFEFLGFKFGLDPLIGLIPGIGELITAALSLYLVWIGWQAKISTSTIIRMVLNVVLDFALGIIPIVGDITDFFYKSNTLNLKLLEQALNHNEVIEEGELTS